MYIMVDESTASMSRYICNIIVGTLKPDTLTVLFLMHTVILEAVNSENVSQVIHDAVIILWPGGVQYEHVFLLHTDAAPYMKKRGKH